MDAAQHIGFLNTPPLWEGRQFGLQQFEFPNMSIESFDPKPRPGNIRLGHQMEHVFKQLLQYSDSYDVMVHNLQISGGNTTLGEIDFILKDLKHNNLIHVELTYKFYIILPEIAQTIHSLVGPNKRDSFYAKLEKIKNIQFPLLNSEEGASALYELNIDHATIEHHCCFKAQLFQYYGTKSVQLGPLNANCVVGFWLRYDEFTNGEFANNQFYVPSKSEWVIEPHHRIIWKSHEEILFDISLKHRNEYAPMLWMKSSKPKIKKLFVVWW